MLFAELYIDNKLVFVSCTDICNKNQTKDVFNTCRYGSFFKFAESEREAVEKLGFDMRELHDAVSFEIPDITEKYIKINGCICMDFADIEKADITADIFARVLSYLYKNLVSMCDDFENSYKHDIESDLIKLTSSLEYEYECVKSDSVYAAGFFSNDYNGLKKTLDSWYEKEYIHLSRWAFERKAYADFVNKYIALSSLS